VSNAFRPSSGTGAVDSVNAQIGVVVLDTDDVGEGALNLYLTAARVAASSPVQSVQGLTGIVVLDTDDIAEGANLYFTNGRADARVTAGIATHSTDANIHHAQAHAASHEDIGGDEISVAGLSGLLADDQHVIDAEAVTAMGVLGDANPLNHDKYTDAELLALIAGPTLKRRTVVGAGDYNPSALTTDYIIAVDNTALPRAVTISSEDVASGTPALPRIFIIKDESGGSSGNNITISLESGGTIDGGANKVILADYNSVTLCIDGTNAHIV